MRKEKCGALSGISIVFRGTCVLIHVRQVLGVFGCRRGADDQHRDLLARRRLAEREIALDLTAAAKEAIAEEGWDPSFGARPLKRAIQRLIENPLAQHLLAGDFSAGDTVLVDAENGEIAFTKMKAKKAASS